MRMVPGSFLAAREQLLAGSVLVLVTFAGCTREGARTTMALGGVSMAGGIALAVGSEPGHNDVVPVGIVLGVACAVLGSSLVVGGAVVLEASDPEPEEAPALVAAERHRSEVVDLTARAIAAAKVGQCDVVRALDVRMAAFDREAHVNGFAANATIRRCLVPR